MNLAKTYLRLCLLIGLVALMGCASSSKDEELAYGHFKIGVTLLSQNKKEQGLEQLQKAHELDPENPLILNHLGLAYFFHQEFELAVLQLRKAVDLKPDYSEAHNNLGRTLIEIGDMKSARHHLSLASQDLTYTNKDKVWFNLGLSFFKEGRFQESQSYFIKSISFNRDNCLAYNYYGRSLLEARDYVKASKALDQAIYHCRKDKFDEPHYYGAVSLYRLGYRSKALARLYEGKKLFPNGENRQKIEDMINLLRVSEIK